ncbi:hypothetical protein AB8I70_001843 [Vibrio cholerae]
MDTVECPYCGHEHEPSGIHEEDFGEWECVICDKKFDVYIDYSPNYHVSKKEKAKE